MTVYQKRGGQLQPRPVARLHTNREDQHYQQTPQSSATCAATGGPRARGIGVVYDFSDAKPLIDMTPETGFTAFRWSCLSLRAGFL